MNVPYDHPPRTVNFYLGYIGLMLVILLPIVPGIAIWFHHLEILWIVVAIVGVLLFRISTVAKDLFHVYVAYEDTPLAKGTDISELNLTPPETLSDTIMQLEMSGFTRLGEYEEWTVQSDVPTPIWFFTKGGGQIIAMLLVADEKPFLSFNTYGKQGLVSITYPRGHDIVLDNARFAGVASSVDDALAYHIQQVRAFGKKIGGIVPIKNLATLLKVDARYGDLEQKRMKQNVIDFMLAQIMSSVAFVPIGAYVISLIPNIYGAFMGWRAVTGVIVILVGFGSMFLISMRSAGKKTIERKQKQKKAKRGSN